MSDRPMRLDADAAIELQAILDAEARRLLRADLDALARGGIAFEISGELYDELRNEPTLDDGTSASKTWGYGVTRAVDVEVHTMTRSGSKRDLGFGRRVRMIGSLDAWRAIAAYARDRGETVRRLTRQAERIDALVNTHTKES